MDFLHKKIVSLLWYIPIFMEWQKETLRKKYDDLTIRKYESLMNRIQGEIERILGYP